MLHLRWPEVADQDLAHYEVRRGTTWLLGEPVYAGPLPECLVDQNWASETYLVQARNAAWRTGPVLTSLAVASALPAGWTAATSFPRDEAATWGGTHTGTTTSGGYLVLSGTNLSGTYQTANVDTGSVAKRKWTGYIDAALVDVTATWATSTFSWDSPEGRGRTWDGAEVTGYAPGLDLETAWSDLTGTWDSYADRTWVGQSGTLGANGLARLEASFSDDAAAWTAWGVMRPQIRRARYVRFRVRLARSSTTFTVQVRALYLHAATDAAWTDSRPPTGTASGDLGGTYPSPTVRQLTTSTPDTLPIGPIAETGVLVRLSSQITTVPSTTWITDTANAVGNTHLRDSTACSLLGRSANSTGDPADIAITEGHHLVRRSNVVTSEELNLDNVWTPSNELVFVDDFLALYTNWTQYSGSGGAAYATPGSSGHPGVWRVSSGGTSGGYVGFSTYASALVVGGTLTMEFLVNITGDATGANVWVGLSDASSGTGDPANALAFQYLKSASANWRYRAGAASTYTTNTSSTAVAFSAWVKLRITYASGTATFYVNGASIGTISTNIPTAVVAPWAFVTQATAGVYTTVDLDYARLRIAGLAR